MVAKVGGSFPRNGVYDRAQCERETGATASLAAAVNSCNDCSQLESQSTGSLTLVLLCTLVASISLAQNYEINLVVKGNLVSRYVCTQLLDLNLSGYR